LSVEIHLSLLKKSVCITFLVIIFVTTLNISQNAFSYNNGSSTDEPLNIPFLINRAKELETKLRFTRPKGDNALEIYRTILKVDPENNEANTGVTRIRDYFLLQGDIARKDRVYTDAAWNYYKALDISPGDVLVISKLDYLNKELKTHSEEQKATELIRKKEEKIYGLISKAEDLKKDPASKNLDATLDLYKQILDLSSENETAREGIENIKKAYLKRAEEAQLGGEYSISVLNYRKVLELTPEDTRIELRLKKVIRQMEMAELRERQKEKSNYHEDQSLTSSFQGGENGEEGHRLLNFEFIEVPAGEFIMGSLEGDEDESPPHKVKVDDFKIGKYEVTQDQWVLVMSYNPSQNSGCGDCPVENVTWDEIQEFLSKASQAIGLKLRLPTEAEWEYAAGWGRTRRTWSGTDEVRSLRNYSWFSLNSDGRSHPVGRKAPNELGAFDMSGNVWEMCSDWYGDKYYPKSTANYPAGPKEGAFRVIRGGAWHSFPHMIRVANRSKCLLHIPDEANGFRVARD